MTKDPLKDEVEVIEEKPKDPIPARGTPQSPPPSAVMEVLAPKSPRPEPKVRAKAANLTLSPEGAKYVRVQYLLDMSHKLEDTFEPEYWAHVSDKFQRPMGEGAYEGSIIELRYPDNSMYAELFIRAVRDKALIVSLMNVTWFGSKAMASSHYFDRWNPGKKLFEVIRKSDGESVFQSRLREKCSEWINKNI